MFNLSYSKCPLHYIILQFNIIINRHNQVAAQIHLDICKHYGIKVDAKSCYEHKSNRVTENEHVTILWDSQIIRDRHIPHNKPDIVIKEK